MIIVTINNNINEKKNLDNTQQPFLALTCQTVFLQSID